jgi:DNA-binding CsgD family transcriptional regulator
MRAGEVDLLAVVDRFQSAALGETSWLEALDGLARATGSRSGQLIGLGSAAAVPFNLMTEMPAESADEFVAIGGGDPAVNRRVALGGGIAEGRVLNDGDFPAYGRPDDPPELRRWIERHDVPHICLSPLIKQDGLLVGLAVLRTRREGQIDPEQQRVFARLAPHLRAAVRSQMMLADQATSVLAGALEALSIAAFVCDAEGTVLARTPLTEPMLEGGSHFRLRGRRLETVHEPDGRALAVEISAAAFGEGGRGDAGPDALGRPGRSTLVRDGAGGDPLLVEVIGLPRDRHPFATGRPVLVMLRPPRAQAPAIAQLAGALYDLTAAEAEIVADLVAGLAPQAIADRRGSAISTVRTHVRRIFEKAAVSSQLELVARINRRL